MATDFAMQPLVTGLQAATCAGAHCVKLCTVTRITDRVIHAQFIGGRNFSKPAEEFLVVGNADADVGRHIAAKVGGHIVAGVVLELLEEAPWGARGGPFVKFRQLRRHGSTWVPWGVPIIRRRASVVAVPDGVFNTHVDVPEHADFTMQPLAVGACVVTCIGGRKALVKCRIKGVTPRAVEASVGFLGNGRNLSKPSEEFLVVPDEYGNDGAVAVGDHVAAKVGGRIAAAVITWVGESWGLKIKHLKRHGSAWVPWGSPSFRMRDQVVPLVRALPAPIASS